MYNHICIQKISPFFMALSASVSTETPFFAPPMRQVFIVNHWGVLTDGHSTDRHLIGVWNKSGEVAKKSGWLWKVWIIWVCLIIRDLSRITVIAIWWEKILETMFFRRYPIFRQTYVILRLAVRHFTNEVMLLAGSKKRSNELPNHPILSHSPNIISSWW